MANGQRLSSEPATALSVRVDGISNDMYGFRGDLRTVQTTMATKGEVAALVESIASLSSKLEAARAPNWQALGVVVTVLALIGGILYWPIREQTNDLKMLMLRSEAQTQDNRVAIAAQQEQLRNLAARYDAVSSRLAEFIRTGK